MPINGAAASANSHRRAVLTSPAPRKLKLTVFMPSARSCARTAIAKTAPTVGESWNPRPMPTPSNKLCAVKLPAPKCPR